MNIQRANNPNKLERIKKPNPQPMLIEDDPQPEDSYDGQHLGKLALGGAVAGGVATAMLDGTARDIISGAGGVVGGVGAGFATFAITALALGGKTPSAGDTIVGAAAGLAVGGGLAYAGLMGGPVLKTVAGAVAGLAAGIAVNAAWDGATGD